MCGKSVSISLARSRSSSIRSGANHGVTLGAVFTLSMKYWVSPIKLCGITSSGSWQRESSLIFCRTQQKISSQRSSCFNLRGIRSERRTSESSGIPHMFRTWKILKGQLQRITAQVRGWLIAGPVQLSTQFFIITLKLENIHSVKKEWPSRGTKVKLCGTFFFSCPGFGLRSLYAFFMCTDSGRRLTQSRTFRR